MPKKGYKQPPEVREAKRQQMLGNKNNLGKKDSEETRERKRQAHLGLKPSEETLEKLRKPKKNTENYHKPKSELHKQHIREALKNRPSTPEWNQKNSENRTGKCMGNTNRLDTKDSDETRALKSEVQKGEQNPNWKGGITPLNIAIRALPEYTSWRDAVFKRDGYKDWFSGCTGVLEVHHIIYFNRILKENNIQTVEDAIKCKALWDINNGITMLKTSHDAYHDMYGKDAWLYQGNVLVQV